MHIAQELFFTYIPILFTMIAKDGRGSYSTMVPMITTGYNSLLWLHHIVTVVTICFFGVILGVFCGIFDEGFWLADGWVVISLCLVGVWSKLVFGLKCVTKPRLLMQRLVHHIDYIEWLVH